MYTLSINNRVYSDPSLHEILADEKNYLFELNYLSLISINGERSAEFLQGQLTCDVRKVNDKTIQQGAFCNLKGRVQALADVIKWDGYKLLLPLDLIPETINSLGKTALVSRVTLTHNTDVKIYGLRIGNPNDLLPLAFKYPNEPKTLIQHQGTCCYALGNNYFLLIIPNEKALNFTHPFAVQDQLLGDLSWHRLQLEEGRVEIYPNTRGLFLPHRLNLHRKDYISFDKGCYKGQEIIARTHYKAKLKHQLKSFTIQSSEPLVAGNNIYDLNGIEVGELIDYSLINTDNYVIVVSILIEHPKEVRLGGQTATCALVNEPIESI